MTLRVTGLTVRLHVRTLLEEIDLEIAAGQVVGLLGPNGSGKSTLLRCLAGLVARHAQQVTLNGVPLAALPLKVRARHIAFVPQHAEVEGDLSVEQIVRLGRTPWRRPFQGRNAADERAVEEAIALMQLAPLRDRLWRQLSGGERQRSQIARALAQQPQILILDEPTNHLDIEYQLELMRLISVLPITVVVALHDLNLAANFCTRLVLLKSGRVVASGSPAAVLTPQRIQQTWGVCACVDRQEAALNIRYAMRASGLPGLRRNVG